MQIQTTTQEVISKSNQKKFGDVILVNATNINDVYRNIRDAMLQFNDELKRTEFPESSVYRITE